MQFFRIDDKVTSSVEYISDYLHVMNKLVKQPITAEVKTGKRDRGNSLASTGLSLAISRLSRISSSSLEYS